MTLQKIKLDQGIHVMHLFYRIERVRWAQLGKGESSQAQARLQELCAQYAAASHPRVVTFANVCGKADLVFVIYAAELELAAQIHRDIEQCFPPGTLVPVFQYLSITELTEYMPTDEDNVAKLVQ